MILRKRQSPRSRTAGFTLAEIAVTMGLSVVVATMVVVLYIFGLKCFAAMNNYAEMDAKSRMSMDQMLREIRQASNVLGYSSNANSVVLTISNRWASSPTINTFTWTKSTKQLTWDKTGQATKTLLSGCTSYGTSLYLRAPIANAGTPTFINTTDLTRTKLINMTWTCVRTNLISRVNTESMTTAEVVLRNLQE